MSEIPARRKRLGGVPTLRWSRKKVRAVLKGQADQVRDWNLDFLAHALDAALGDEEPGADQRGAVTVGDVHPDHEVRRTQRVLGASSWDYATGRDRLGLLLAPKFLPGTHFAARQA